MYLGIYLEKFKSKSFKSAKVCEKLFIGGWGYDMTTVALSVGGAN